MAADKYGILDDIPLNLSLGHKLHTSNIFKSMASFA